MKKQNICFQYQKSDSGSKNLNKQSFHSSNKQVHASERQLTHMPHKQKQQREDLDSHWGKIVNQGDTRTDHYITVQMYKNDKQIQTNRKLSEIIIKNELLSMEANEKGPSFKMKNNIFHKMKRKQKQNAIVETESKKKDQIQEKKPSFLSHGLERSAEKSQPYKKYSNEDNQEKSPSKKNLCISTQNEWNIHMNKIDIDADFINPAIVMSRDRSRNMSNFQKLKLEAQQLEKSNIVLGTKQQDHFYYVEKTKVQSVANKTLRQKGSIKSSYNNASISFSNPQIQNKTQRTRYKYSLTNRKNKGSQIDDRSTIQLDMGDSKQQCTQDPNFGYQFAHKQLNSRSTKRIKTQIQKQRVEVADSDRAKLKTRQNILEENNQKLNQLQEKTIKHMVTNFQLKHSSESQDKQIIIKQCYTQEPTEILKPITASSCNRNTHISSQPDIYSCQDNISADQQYVINNEFIPFASRSVIDKNRKNIKKISKNINRILTSKNTNNNLNSCRNDYINSNIYIQNRISVGEQLLMNKLSSIELGSKWSERKNIMNLKSFYEHSFARGKQPENDSPVEVIRQLNIGRDKKAQTASDSLISKDEKLNKMDRTNAQKFYRGQATKIKDKANRIISDPYLKTKGITIKKQQQKEQQSNERNNDILIICL